jgi:hypothetical protein
MKIAEEFLDSSTATRLCQPEVLARALHLLGQTFMHKQNLFWDEAWRTLTAAFEGGNDDAGLDMAAYHLVSSRRHSAFSPRLDAFIKTRAREEKDWRAMSLHLGALLNQPEKSKESEREYYEMALELRDLTVPSRVATDSNAWLLRGHYPTWALVNAYAKRYLKRLDPQTEKNEIEAVQRERSQAVREGVDDWKDPDAALERLRDSDVLPRHSSQWLDLAAATAAGGSADAALDLAIYHLTQDGWRSKDLSRTPTEFQGIEWLAASAVLSSGNASRTTSTFLAVMYLLHEHRYVEDEEYWFAFAKSFLLDAELDPGGSFEKMLNNHHESLHSTNEKLKAVLESSEDILGRLIYKEDRLPDHVYPPY